MDIRTSARLIAGMGALTVLLAACSGSPASVEPTSMAGQAPPATDSPPATSTPIPTPMPTPTPTPTSPLTGLPAPTPGVVLAVKLDNTRNAQPHAGLHEADVVYIEEVEYGMTRLAAVFSSQIPDRIGPVRSARITDLDLLEQYGSPAFSFSGVQSKMWPLIDESPLIDISPNKAAFAYQRDSTRRAPYNYFLDGQQGVEAATGASLATDVGFVFDATPPPGGSVGLSALVEWPAASAEFRYDQASRLYLVNLNGERAEAEEHDQGQRAATVVIQYVEQEASPFFDKGGGNTPHALTIGQGEAIVLRDGLVFEASWSRPDVASGTSFTLADGSPMTFKPGQQWVALVNRERPIVIFPDPNPKPSPAED